MRASLSSALYQPLDGVLGSLANLRVARALAVHGGQLDVADLARRTALTLPSVRTALRHFLNTGLVAGVGAGKSMIFSLATNHQLASAVIALFEEERRQANLVFDAVRAGANALSPAPRAVWLYGSVARGDDTDSSDIDVAVVGDRSHTLRQAEALREALARAFPVRSDRISVIAIPLPDIRRMSNAGDRFWRELERDAVVILGEAPADLAGRRKTSTVD